MEFPETKSIEVAKDWFRCHSEPLRCVFGGTKRVVKSFAEAE